MVRIILQRLAVLPAAVLLVHFGFFLCPPGPTHARRPQPVRRLGDRRARNERPILPQRRNRVGVPDPGGLVQRTSGSG
jgi:hypothetical protein